MIQNAKENTYPARTCDGCDAEAREGYAFPRWDLGGDAGAYLCRTCWGREGRAHGRRPWLGMVKLPEALARHVLRYRWSVSRADGYNVVTLSEGGQRYATARGGGYDMTGSVLADWLEARYPVRLAQLAAERAGSTWSRSTGARTERHYFMDLATGKPNKHHDPRALYGLTYHIDAHKASVDGACGVSSVCAVMKALGLSFTEDSGNWNRQGRRRDDGLFFVSPITQEA